MKKEADEFIRVIEVEPIEPELENGIAVNQYLFIGSAKEEITRIEALFKVSSAASPTLPSLPKKITDLLHLVH